MKMRYIRPCVHRTCPAYCCGEHDEEDEKQEQFDAEVNLASTPMKLQWKLYKHGLMITNFRGGAVLHFIKTKAYQAYIRDEGEFVVVACREPSHVYAHMHTHARDHL